MNNTDIRIEKDSLGEVKVPADRLWGAQTQRSLEHFSIGKDLIPREMITAYAILKKAAANANHASKRLDDQRHKLIVQVCDEIFAGQHHDMFPLHVWMTGSGTQFNMNVNEVISNRCCQLAGTALASKTPVHPNDHVNMAQSSNDSFPSAMYIATAISAKDKLIPAVKALHDGIAAKAEEWKGVIKIGRTHMQDATPLTLGQEWSGYVGRYWHQFGARLCRVGCGRDCQAHGFAVRYCTEQVHGAGCPRRSGPILRYVAYAGRVAL